MWHCISLVLSCGSCLLTHQCFDVNVQTKGPVIIVIYSLVALITLGAAISFFTDKNMGSTIFLGGLLTVIAIIFVDSKSRLGRYLSLVFYLRPACIATQSIFLEKKTKKWKKSSFSLKKFLRFFCVISNRGIKLSDF